VPRFAASRTVEASPEEVWTFLAEPGNLPRWWPGIAEVEAGRQGLAPGARWRVVGPNRPSYLRRPEMNGQLLVLEAVPGERLAFQLVSERVGAELDLRALAGGRAEASLVVEAPWLAGIRRSFPHAALARLADRLEAARGGS
jgi:uncharacterized protein YndB with AHSA1/START domain